MENIENRENEKSEGKGKSKTKGPESQEASAKDKDKDKDNKDKKGGEAGKVEAEEKKVQDGPSQEKQEEESFKSKYYYLAAEMENMKRRMQKEKEGLLKFGNEKILLDLLEVIDNFERTIDALKEDEDKKIKNIVTGIDMVKKQFSGILQKYGLTVVESLGKTFDPNFHEAVSQKAVEGKGEDEILEEYQKGYVLNGRLLRPAKVVVSRPE